MWRINQIKPFLFPTILIVLIIISYVFAEISLQNSPKALAAKQYASVNEDIRKTIDEITGYGLWTSHYVEKAEQNSYMSFFVKGTKTNRRIKFYFVKDSGDNWVISRHEFL